MFRYACLPSYNCELCYLGKPVAKNTMLRHRSKANSLRREQGLSLLPWGPRLPPGNTHFDFTNYQESIIDIPSRNGNISNAAQSINASYENIASSNEEEAMNNVFIHSNAEPLSNYDDTNMVDTESSLPNPEVPLQLPLRANEGLPMIDGYFGNSDDSSDGCLRTEGVTGEATSQLEECADSVRTIPRPFSREVTTALDLWAENNFKVFELYYVHSPTHSLMNDLLKNIVNCPTSEWKNVQSYITRKSGIQPCITDYRMCPGHFCFPFNARISHCPVCNASVPALLTPKTRYRYIKLWGSIQEIYGNEMKHKAFRSYLDQYDWDNDLIEDIFDGDMFGNLAERYGGVENIKEDVFLAISTDGFQAYKNRQCDVWPVLAVFLNLSPRIRYLVQNILPLAFIPGGEEPKMLQSFFSPLIEEIRGINSGGGQLVKLHNGTYKRIRVHVVVVTADLAALRKLLSLSGHNGKHPCRYCEIAGFYVSGSRGYYYPSWFYTDSSRRKKLKLYDIYALPLRTKECVLQTFAELESCSSPSQRASIAKETGIQEKSELFSLLSLEPFGSFPVDVMHLFFNVQKHLLSLHLCVKPEPFALTASSIDQLTDELLHFSKGMSGQLCPAPRPLMNYKNWKAAELKHFTLNYCLILFDGHLPNECLDGLSIFSELAHLCFQYTLTQRQVEQVESLSTTFISHFENFYVKRERDRIHYFRYTIHLLLHLSLSIRQCGPLMCSSQYWVEKYIGWIMERTNARNNAAQSMTGLAIYGESFKNYTSVQVEKFWKEAKKWNIYKLYQPHSEDEVPFHPSSRRFIDMLANFIVRKHNEISIVEAKDLAKAVRDIQCWKRIRLPGDGQIANIFDACSDTRPSCYVAVEMDANDTSSDIYYGKILQMHTIYFGRSTSYELSSDHYDVVLLSWASGIMTGNQKQLFKEGDIGGAFTSPTMEDASTLRRLIGVVSHKVPPLREYRGSRISRSSTNRKRSYFIDNRIRSDCLLDASTPSLDGVYRTLRGLR